MGLTAGDRVTIARLLWPVIGSLLVVVLVGVIVREVTHSGER